MGQGYPQSLIRPQAWALSAEFVGVIDKFFRELPDHVAPAEGVKAEAFLAQQAASLRPDQLEKLATQLAIRLNPDGNFSDADRARKRGFAWCGGQGPDGMSTARLVATPDCGPCWKPGWPNSRPRECANHKYLIAGGWKTRKLKDGSTQWVPPPHLPLQPGTNTYHHPEQML